MKENLVQICNDRKNAQIDTSQIFQAISANTMFTLDTRINKADKVAADRAYKGNVQFNALSTTSTGGLAVGSLNGDIRLYKQVGSNASTLLPGLQDPITSIEVSRDS